MPWPLSFPVARYRLEFATERAIHLPEYAGSALRGAFGHALRRVACVTGASECGGCALFERCAYIQVFESPPPHGYDRRKFTGTPHPFVVEPPPWGESEHAPGSTLAFDFVLVGPALELLPLLVLAWRRALQTGLGPTHGTARLQRVWVEGDDEPVVADPAARPRPHRAMLDLPPPEAAPDAVALDFVTPLRLQSNGRALGLGELTPHALLMALLRRVATLSEMQLGVRLDVDFAGLNARAPAVRGEPALAWRDWTRHSSRQQQRMVLGGAVGSWTLAGDLAPFWPLLYLGQWLHVGKSATFGLGRYRLEAST
jgi:hypothetical protein